ncbi:MAG: hypothetical protein WA781_21595, partial [Pseudolabrys sp.]
MNNGIRITIDRRDSNRWYWRLNAYGDEYFDVGHGEASPAKAVQAAESRLFTFGVAKRRAMTRFPSDIQTGPEASGQPCPNGPVRYSA